MSEISPKEVRKYIFDCFLENARAPLVEEMMDSFHLSRDDVLARLDELESSHQLLLLPGTQRILMANPFSNLPTPFRVSSGDKQYFANCAWDAVAFHVMLDQEIQISSYCHHCGASIELHLNQGRLRSVEAKDVLVFLGTPVSRWYDNLLTTCSNTMVFFRSQHLLQEWQRSHPELSGEALTVDKMIEVVTPISKGRATLEYQMPSTGQLMAYWDSIGLRGAFWKF